MTTRRSVPVRARIVLLALARAVLLAGPTVLAFFAGGYFTEAQAWAGLAAWLLVAGALLLKVGRPNGTSAWVAIAGMGLLAAWTLASVAWAPLAGSAYHAGQLVVMYTGALIAAGLLLGSPRVRGWVEPALALGTVIVIGYGLSERMLPGLLHFSRSVSAGGRLEQPLTYWNAMGELAAIGFVLCVRLAGDRTRPDWVSAPALAACAPLALGVYTSFSRGALFACLAGLVALAVAAPDRRQLRAIAVAVVLGALATASAAALRGVTGLSGSLGTREQQGAIVLACLVVLMVLAAAAQRRFVGRGASAPLRLPRRAPWLALVAICGGLAVAILVGAKETTAPPSLGSGSSRLVSLRSDRYAYWDVALRAFAHEPIYGVGAGGWAVWWLRYRSVNDFAQDAHSLPLQTAAELGLVGLVFLGMLFVGVAVAARRVHARAPALAAGPIAALVVYAAHSPLDWDWQMPAVTLVAVLSAGLILGCGQDARAPAAAQAASGA